MKFFYHGTYAFVCILFIAAQSAYSLPQFAVLINAKCMSCHVNAQGGGLRTFRGRRFLSDVGLFKPDHFKLNTYSGKSNTVFNRTLKFGTDFRLQMTRSHKSSDSERRFFPMQAVVYADYEVVGWLHTEASYNFGPKRFDGQQSWTASVIIQPEFSYTQFRIGYFQPLIGIRYDDHTMLARRIPGADGNTLIPPNYAEYGAEFTYNGLNWLAVTAGVFDTGSLADNTVIDNDGRHVSLIENEHNPSWLGRLVFQPRVFEGDKSFSAGSSYFVQDDFSIFNLFTGIGMIENLSIMADYTRMVKTDMRTSNSFMLECTYRLSEPVLLTVRGETGETISRIGGNDIETYSDQVLMGAQLFVLPNIEVRPEYRILDTERYKSSRYALQLHIFL